MPIYEYQCGTCEHRFEVKQSIKDDPIKECVRCGKAVTKLISPPAIMFKGSGWYITDYSDKMKPGGSDTSDKPAAGTETTKAPATSDSTGDTPASTPAPAAPAPSTATSTPSSTGTSASTAGSSSSSSTTSSTNKS